MATPHIIGKQHAYCRERIAELEAQYASLLRSHGAGPVWCTACEGSGLQLLSVGGTRCASDHPCQQCAGLGKHLSR